MNLGAIQRNPQTKVLDLGMVQSPSSFPATYQPPSYAQVAYFQGVLPTCSAHAGASLQSTLRGLELGQNEPLSPRFLWQQIKQIDGIPPNEGSDMPSIFKALQNSGICNYGLSPDNIELSLPDYTDPSNIASNVLADAETREISADAYLSDLSMPSLQNAVWQNKALLILLRLNTEGGNWFGNPIPKYDPSQPSSGHFVNAFGYSTDGLLVADSADKLTPIKTLTADYPLLEAGCVTDIPLATMAQLLKEKSLLQELIQLYEQLLHKHS